MGSEVTRGRDADLDLPGFHAQTVSVALGAGGVSAITAQENANMELVFLTLEMAEESAHAEEFAFAVEYQVAMLLRHIDPGHIERDACLLRISLQVR